MLEEMGKAAKRASYHLAELSSAQKNDSLLLIMDYLEQDSELIFAANQIDIEQARADGLSDALLDRLLLTPSRLMTIINDVRHVCNLSDPVGQIIGGGYLDSGLHLERRRVPLGVVGVIYESRPNVTIDVVSLCIKTGNAVILRGGKETRNTNKALVNVIRRALEKLDLPCDAVQAIENQDRALVIELLKLDRYIDILIPRGGSILHRLCREQSTIPVITGGIGVCHIYVDKGMDMEQALNIIVNAKTQRPSTCNTLETLLVNQDEVAEFLPRLSQVMQQAGVSLHACPRTLPLLEKSAAMVMPLNKDELNAEWLSLDLNVVIVDDLECAIEHIREHGTQHSEAILTRNMQNAERFVRAVDAAAVYVNASTRFTDGGEFGLGAEVAVSTQKLHARGPMGLEALTTYKWIGYGHDLIRR